MQLSILLQNDLRFECHGCGDCCRQPYRVLIDAQRADALRRHDFSRYPLLRAGAFLQPSADGRKDLFEITKGDNHRCAFLDDANRCIIHAELGADAKPVMCREFPLISSVTWTERRVSASFACPSVRSARGPTLTDAREETHACLPTLNREAVACPSVQLTQQATLPPAEFELLADRLADVFRPGADDIWQCFAKSLALCADAMTAPGSPATPALPAPRYRHPSVAPLPVRMLFAVTLYPDAVPAGTVSRLRLKDKLTMIPRLMSLSRMTGLYASRLLERNVSIDAVLRHTVSDDLTSDATDLLRDYFRTRIWQRLLIGTRMPVVAGIHQHLLDFNAILFLARCAASSAEAPQLNRQLIGDALALVEFHIANQERLHQHALRRWLMAALSDVSIAQASLGLMRPSPVAADAENNAALKKPLR